MRLFRNRFMCNLKYVSLPGGMCSLSELRAGTGQPLRIAFSEVTGMNVVLLINNFSAQNLQSWQVCNTGCT